MRKRILSLAGLLTILSLSLAACGPTPQPEIVKETVVVTEEVEKVVTATPEAVAEPTEVNIVGFIASTTDESWNKTLVQSLDRVAEARPHGLQVNYEIVEKVAWADVERIAREYAQTGEYDIIWYHTGYRDAARKVQDEFPDQLFALISAPGSFTEDYQPGKNVYWINSSAISACSYLTGLLAGHLTESNIIGITASYPSSDINDPVNAFMEGARSVNPDVKFKITFIESWYDPAKAREAAAAQLNLGADFIYSTLDGTVEAVREHGALLSQMYVDISDMAPDVFVTAPLGRWDPWLYLVIDEWWDHTVYGRPYRSPEAEITFTMRDGTCDLSPISEDLVPAEVIDSVMAVRQKILDGELVIGANYEMPESD